MSVIVHDSGHLRRLRALRAEVDRAIRLEEERLERAARLRVVPAGPRPEPRRRAPDQSTAAIRAWAISQGLPVGERGRISSELRREYELAHPVPLGSVNEG